MSMQCEALTLWLQENGQQDWDEEQTVDAWAYVTAEDIHNRCPNQL